MTPLVDDLRAAIRASGTSHDQLATAAGIPLADVDRLMSDQPDLSLHAAERLASVLGFELEAKTKQLPAWLEDDEARKVERERLRALADAWAYEGAEGRARRVEERELIAFNCVLQVVYLTPDSLFFVDYWYRQKLGFRDDPGNTVVFDVSGRRMSIYRDNLKYRREPTTKNGKMTVRQFVFEAGRTRFIVMFMRRPDVAMTEIVITVLPQEGGPGTPEPTRPPKVEPLDGG
jgi:plasmid maintenance system antidote protein VapI